MLKVIFSTYCQVQCTKKILYCNGLSLRFQSKYEYKKTFQFKILTYFENTLTTYKISQQNAVSTKLRENLPETKALQKKLMSIYNCVKKLSNSKIDEIMKKKLQNQINKECILVINLLEPLELLIVLNKLIRNISVKYKSSRISFYDQAFSMLIETAETGLLSEHGVVQLIFFICLKEESCVDEIRYLEQFLPPINSLPLIEQSVIGVSYYRSHIQLNSDQFKEFGQSIEKHAEQLLDEPELLVSICKILRLSKACDKLILENFSKNIIKSKHSMNFTMIAHVLSLYAEAKLFHPEVIERIIIDFVKIIRNDINKFNLRLKDLVRFLWASSHLGIIFTDDKKSLLKLYTEKRFPEFIKKKNLGMLVDALLSLHTMQCWNDKIVKQCLEKNIFQTISNEKFYWKIKTKLNILLIQITLEMKIEVPQNLIRKVQSVYESTENLNLIKDIGYALVEKGIIKNVVMEYPIQAIYIPGVTLITDTNKYHIDILNDSICLRNTNTPIGLMNLKTRLLSQLKYQHILINTNIFGKHLSETRSKIYQEIISIINVKQSSLVCKEN